MYKGDSGEARPWKRGPWELNDFPRRGAVPCIQDHLIGLGWGVLIISPTVLSEIGGRSWRFYFDYRPCWQDKGVEAENSILQCHQNLQIMTAIQDLSPLRTY